MLQFSVARRLSIALRRTADASGTVAEELYPRERPQFALYPGGGTCYKAHVDNPRLAPGPDGDASDNLRRVTLCYYLNEGWSAEEDGGALRVHDAVPDEDPQRTGVPSGGSADGYRDIEPVANRLVIFLADRVVHEVLPAMRDRTALTVWLSAPPPRETGALNASDADDESMLRLYRHVTRDVDAGPSLGTIDGVDALTSAAAAMQVGALASEAHRAADAARGTSMYEAGGGLPPAPPTDALPRGVLPPSQACLDDDDDDDFLD
jgi:hypothetical protein